MTTFQILTLILSTIIFIAGIIGLYIKNSISIAKIEVEICQIKKDLLQKEIALCNLEKDNKTDHKEIVQKIDRLINNFINSGK